MFTLITDGPVAALYEMDVAGYVAQVREEKLIPAESGAWSYAVLSREGDFAVAGGGLPTREAAEAAAVAEAQTYASRFAR